MPSHSFCIHGHFYQPSREDPLTGLIPDESGSEPYHNWNERVNDRCYRPNAEAGNFEKISFNIGPTLVRWLDKYSTPTIKKVIYSDRLNLERHGVGNAMAQPYHHTILPLASKSDKEIQVRWGIADFKHTFGHTPQGMWLPEAAVDMETLSVLAGEGIEYTILSPGSIGGNPPDPGQPGKVLLPNGKSIVVIFYNEAISSGISFDPYATSNAEQFISNHLKQQFSSGNPDQLVLAATDGELYGHHQPFRDKFLAYLLDGALSSAGIETTYPGLWLKGHPVSHEITIKENTSWSCAHGVTRWTDVCGCTPGGEWKKGLREFLNGVADRVDDVYFNTSPGWLKDPEKAREEIIGFVIGEEMYPDWVKRNAKDSFSTADGLSLRKLMQAQFERQRMFTSCGWFFEQFDRIEPQNNLKYAAQAVALTEIASKQRFSETLLAPLMDISSTINGSSAADTFRALVEQFRQNSRPY